LEAVEAVRGHSISEDLFANKFRGGARVRVSKKEIRERWFRVGREGGERWPNGRLITVDSDVK